MTRLSQQGIISLQPAPPVVPVVQFLTIPLKNDHPRQRNINLHRGIHRYFSSTFVVPSTRSSFQEDYDELYSHGKVASTTKEPPMDGNDDLQYAPDLEPAGFLLNEIRQEEEEEEMRFDAHLRQQQAGLNTTHVVLDDLDEEEWGFVEGQDDFDLEDGLDRAPVGDDCEFLKDS